MVLQVMKFTTMPNFMCAETTTFRFVTLCNFIFSLTFINVAAGSVSWTNLADGWSVLSSC